MQITAYTYTPNSNLIVRVRKPAKRNLFIAVTTHTAQPNGTTRRVVRSNTRQQTATLLRHARAQGYTVTLVRA